MTKVRTIAAAAFLIGIVGAHHAQSSNFEKSQWTEPVNLGSINSNANEQNVFLTKDELTLYFTSNRPGGTKDLDIYVAHRASVYSEWQEPVRLPAPVNSAANDFGPNLSRDEHLLFFASSRAGGFGNADIYVSRREDPNDDFGWETPVNVGPPVNTADAEQAPVYMQNAEDGAGNLYFNRGLQTAQLADFYYGAVTRDGVAQGEVVLVTELNSAFNDFAITIRHDGREAFFTSQRPGSNGPSDLFTSTRQSIHDPWDVPRNAGTPPNSEAADVTPHLSFDGRTMIFASTRAGGHGGNDLWMSTRK